MGLSRQSTLNDRYFEKEKQRSRSLDNLLNGTEIALSASKLANLGLSSSKLNERYHSLERIAGDPVGGPGSNGAINGNGDDRKYGSRMARNAEPNIMEEEDLTIDFEDQEDMMQSSVSQTGKSEDDKSSYARSQQSRFIKSHHPGNNIQC